MRWFNIIPRLNPRIRKERNLYDPPPEAHLDVLRKQLAKDDKGVPEPMSLPCPEGLTTGAPVLGLRVDVDTHEGMRDGVPKLLEILKEAGVKATFYLAMGPDRSGLAVLNAFKPGFLKKMFRTGAPKVYGWRTLLSGTLLPARPVATGFPDIARRIAEEGHEAGVHAWDHRVWQDRLTKFSEEQVASQLGRAAQAFEQIYGTRPRTFAAPAWLCDNESLRYQEGFGLDYASDCRGMDPFLPNIERRTLKTPQVPTTLATLDETLGDADPDAASFFNRLLQEVKQGEWPVLTVHAELEGGPYAADFTSFLKSARGKGVQVVPLRDLLALRLSTGKPLPRCTMSYGEIEGRAGAVALQMLEV